VKVHKTVVTITVLHTEPLGDLVDVLGEMEYGNAIGGETERVHVDLPAESVREELLALGNDGEFFND